MSGSKYNKGIELERNEDIPNVYICIYMNVYIEKQYRLVLAKGLIIRTINSQQKLFKEKWS